MNEMPLRPVFSAPIQSLYIWTYAEPRPELLQRLAERAMVAGNRDTALWLGDEELRFVLHGHGWRNYPFVLAGADFEIALGSPAPFPRVVITATASFVERLGVEAACQEVAKVLADYILANFDGGYFWLVQQFDPQEYLPNEPPATGDAA